MALIWPAGYTAKGTPLAVFDQTDKRIGVVGRPVALGGGLVPPDFHDPVPGCTGYVEAFIVEGPAPLLAASGQ